MKQKPIKIKVTFEDTPIFKDTIKTEKEFNDFGKILKAKLWGKK
jgi:hypothetical protein